MQPAQAVFPADEISRGPHPWGSDATQRTRLQARAFALEHVAPSAQQWDEAGTFPVELYRTAGAAGILGAGFPEELGGSGGDIFDTLAVKEDLARFGSGGVRVALTTHTIALPPLLAIGARSLVSEVAPAVLGGDKLMALAVTERQGGSDVANLTTTAVADGGSYIVNGRKLFISTGIRADYITLAVRTGGPGKSGVSLLLIRKGLKGLQRLPLKKTGWWSSDTAELVFTDCRVPRDCLIGEEGAGFKALMANFNAERLGNAAIMLGASKACYDDAVAWARSRIVFGEPLAARQVIRHKLVDMATRIQAVECLLGMLAWRYSQGIAEAAQIAMLKNLASETCEMCASEAVQIHGGHGILRSNRVDRLFRESKILSIGGGAAEILKDLAARQLHY
ncbi:MAG TPA: acyl-CoA dehydrogenase family protein [Burkholderiaceae bacterium]|nr:acyl-CoA dehydrogenase family protein [Burkholderiaceae bacterium]